MPFRPAVLLAVVAALLAASPLAGSVAELERRAAEHQQRGEHPEAVALLEQALEWRRAAEDGAAEADTRTRLGLSLQRLGRWDEARSQYETALALARSLDDPGLEGKVLNNLGGLYANLGEPDRQEEALLRALLLRRSAGDTRGVAAALNNLGSYHRHLGEMDAALVHFGQAVDLFETLDDRYWLARAHNNLGSAYLAFGDPERSRAHLLAALPLRREVGDRAGEAVTLRNLGRTFAALDQRGQALAFAGKALALSLDLEDTRGAITARRLLGEIQEAIDPAAARAALEPALAAAREMGNRHETAEILATLGAVALRQGARDEAVARAEESLALHRRVRDPLGEVRALELLARADRLARRWDDARARLDSALDRLEAVQDHLAPGQRAPFLATRRTTYELYVDTLVHLHGRRPAAGHHLEALAASERARARALLADLDHLEEASQIRDAPDLAPRLRSAERRLAAKTERQLQVLSGAASIEEARRAEVERQEALTELDRVRAEIRRRVPRSDTAMPPPIGADEIRRLLDDDTVLVEILLGEERSFLWWVTRQQVSVHELAAGREIEALALRVHEALSVIGPSARSATRQLGSALFGPVANRLDGQRLVVVADGALHRVPFAVLEPSGDGTPLLARHEVVHLPSASVLAALRRQGSERRRPSGLQLAVLADPVFRPGEFDRLPHTRLEADALAGLVPADRRLVALGTAARVGLLDDERISRARILHFATHGFVHPRLPEVSGLVLSQLDDDGQPLDGLLDLSDLARLDLAAELVVLSGCRTALGRQIEGEGPVGLARGFMATGVPRVVASHWQVRDGATAHLMERFYRRVLEGNMTPAAALRATQLELRSERRTRDPYYWGAFAFQGDWR